MVNGKANRSFTYAMLAALIEVSLRLAGCAPATPTAAKNQMMSPLEKVVPVETTLVP
jgi:hypothetical protein